LIHALESKTKQNKRDTSVEKPREQQCWCS